MGYNKNMNYSVLRRLHKELTQRGLTVAAAESCTAGLLSSLLTELPGSSAFFLLGIAAYSNNAKTRILGIPARIIRARGAVSREIAVMMARAIRIKAKSDIGIGITGIAGPAGATPRKPAGTVFIAVNSKRKNVCTRFLFSGTRSDVRRAAARESLLMLHEIIHCP